MTTMCPERQEPGHRKLPTFWANGTMNLVGASMSKSSPFTTTLPSRRLAVCVLGPNRFQIFWAAAAAAASLSDQNEPSVYVAPPIERRVGLA